MIEPTGYTALDLIGFTDRGAYDPTANYVKNDIVTIGNTKWRCKVDDTTGVTPAENANWTIYLESATSLAGMDDVTLTSPKNGDGLVHDGNDWKNVPIMTKAAQDDLGAVNILLHNGANSVHRGITYIVNPDKSISANGTVENAASYFTAPVNVPLKAGSYKLSGFPKNAGFDGYLAILDSSNNVIAQQTQGSSDTKEFTINQDYSSYQLFIRIEATEIVDHKTFKPMLTPASVPQSDYDHYVAPAKTNRELTNLPNNLGASVALTGYTSENNMYEFPSDGYVRYAIKGNQTGSVVVYGNNGDTTGSAYLMFGTSSAINATTTTVLRGSVYVRKGMRAYCSGTVASADFIPLK